MPLTGIKLLINHTNPQDPVLQCHRLTCHFGRDFCKYTGVDFMERLHKVLPPCCFKIPLPEARSPHCSPLSQPQQLATYFNEKSRAWNLLHPKIRTREMYRLGIDCAAPRPSCPPSPWDEKQMQIYLSNAWSFERYMKEALYGDNGYYSAGNVVFGDAGDFITSPLVTNNLACKVILHGYQMYCTMKAAGDLGENDEFTIFEFGAGNGDLAFQVLDKLKELSTDTSGFWPKEMIEF